MKYIPGIFGEKSTLAKNLGPRNPIKRKEHKPEGRALALSKALLAKKK